MNRYEEMELSAKYALCPDAWKLFVRCLAYSEFDSRLEVYEANDYANNHMGNEGRELRDIPVEQVEEILDDFVERFSEEIMWQMDESMNNSILSVTGIYC